MNTNKAQAYKVSKEPILAGHQLMAVERFAEDTRHMIVFDVLSDSALVGSKGERMRLFLSDADYQKALESQSRGEFQIIKHANVYHGDIRCDRPKEEMQ